VKPPSKKENEMSTPVERVFAIAAAGLAVVALAACGGDGNDSAATTPAAATAVTSAPATSTSVAAAPTTAPGTVVDVAAASSDFTTLVAAIKAAGLTDTLSGSGPFTVFAPTNEAFATALQSLGLTADQLLADKDTLTKILTYHVIAGAVPSSTVMTMDGQSVPTVNGAKVTIGVDGQNVTVNDAKVTAVDIPASNGVIHVIDSVLVPPAG